MVLKKDMLTTFNPSSTCKFLCYYFMKGYLSGYYISHIKIRIELVIKEIVIMISFISEFLIFCYFNNFRTEIRQIIIDCLNF